MLHRQRLNFKKRSLCRCGYSPQSYQSINKIIKEIEIKKKQHDVTNFETIAKFDQLNLINNSNTKVSLF